MPVYFENYIFKKKYEATYLFSWLKGGLVRDWSKDNTIISKLSINYINNSLFVLFSSFRVSCHSLEIVKGEHERILLNKGFELFGKGL